LKYYELSFSEHFDAPFYKHVGELTLIWNLATHALFVAFVGLSGMNAKYAASVYFSLRSDGAQREVVRSLAKARLADDSDPQAVQLYDSLKSEINNLEKIAQKRNGAVHATILSDQKGYLAADPFAFSGPNRHAIFRDPERTIKEIEDAVRSVCAAINRISRYLSWPEALLDND